MTAIHIRKGCWIPISEFGWVQAEAMMSGLIPTGRKKWLILMSVVVSAALVYLSFSIISDRYGARKYERGYQQINVGYSKELVIGLMGRPTKTTDCGYAAFPDKKDEVQFKMRCAEQYWYVLFLKDYIISLDKEGRVISKNSAVSP